METNTKDCPGWPALPKDCPGWPTLPVDTDTWRVYLPPACQTCPEAALCAHSVRVAAGYVDADPPAR